MLSQRKRSRRNPNLLLETLEGRQLLSATFANSDLNGPWTLSGMGVMGSVQFDGTGNITGGSITDDTGNNTTATGNYSMTSTGSGTGTVEGESIAGAMNSNKDFIAFSGSGTDSLGALTNGGAGSYSSGDLDGTWYAFATGDPSTVVGGQTIYQGNSGHGTIQFDGSGNLNSTLISDVNNPTENFPGNYTVSSSGAVSLNIGTAPAIQNYSGAMNASKSVVILNPPDLAQAAQYNSARMFVLVLPSGSYSNSSLNGAWTVILDGLQGTLNFDGTGRFTGSASDGALSGQYDVAADGTFTLTLSPSAATNNKTENYAGTIDSTDSIAAMDQPTGGENDDMALLVNSGGSGGGGSTTDKHAPTLTKITALKTAQPGQPFAISYAALLAASNAADADGDTISFQITSLGKGTLTLNSGAAIAGTDLSSGESLIWTPLSTAKGNVTAFSVKAFDGTKTSKKAVAVKITTSAAATVQITASKNKVAPATAKKAATEGTFTLKRSGGSKSAALSVSFSESGTASSGVDFTAISSPVSFAAGKASTTISVIPLADAHAAGPVTLILSLTPSNDGSYTIDSALSGATITISE